MKVILPNGEIHELNDDLCLEEKLDVVRELVEEWKPIIHSGWDSNRVKYFLDSLSNYLVWHKEGREEGKRGYEDKDILSRKKLERMSKFKSTTKEINFTDLNSQYIELLFGETRGVDND